MVNEMLKQGMEGKIEYLVMQHSKIWVFLVMLCQKLGYFSQSSAAIPLSILSS